MTLRSMLLAVTLTAVALAACPTVASGAARVADEAGLQACANAATTQYPYAVPTTGTVRASMVFVDFPDAAGVTPTQDVAAQLAEAEDWFTENSYGQFRLEIQPVHGWRRMSQPSDAYPLRRDDPGTWEDERDYMQEAVDLADPDHDFSGSDIVYVVAAEGAAQDFSPAYTFNPGDLVVADGTEINAGSALGGNIYEDGGALGPIVLAHETGHLLGEPDLYDLSAGFDTTHRFVGPWDTMGSMFEFRHFSAWTKFRLGWLAGERVRCLDTPTEATFTLSPTTRGAGLTALIVPTSRWTAVVLEARHPELADSSICDGGLLVSSVDERLLNEQGRVRVEPAAADDPERVDECGELHNAPFGAGDTFDAHGVVATVEQVDAQGNVTVHLRSPGLGAPFTGQPGASRFAGEDPIATAIAVSRTRFADGEAGYAVLSRDDAFADSLAGAPLAAEGPLLLTAGDRLDAAVADELDRAVEDAGLVYLLGGVNALSDQVAADLRAAGFAIARLSGPSRVETAIAVADEIRSRFDTAPVVALARADAPGGNPTAGWADSVTGGAWAAAERFPVLLTPSGGLHEAVARWLSFDRTERTVLLGGTAALSSEVEAAVPGPQRVSGTDRAATAAEVATRLWGVGSGPARRFVAVNGYAASGWAYGLPAAGIAADRGAPLVLVDTTTVPQATRTLVSGCDGELVIAGPQAAISPETAAELEQVAASAC